MTNPRTPWTAAENLALCRLYFRMLDAATAGRDYNKAAMIRTVQGIESLDGLPPRGPEIKTPAPLKYRSRGSIEAKLMNASAAHHDQCLKLYGRAPVDSMANHGYKAWGNYQAALADAMAAELHRRHGIKRAEA